MRGSRQRLFAWAIGFALIPAANAAVNCQVLAYGAQMPNYFSATYCHASGSFASTDGTIVWAALSIGGTMVKEWPESSFNGFGPPVPTGLSAIFDSTHFSDGQSVQIKIEARDSLGHYGYAQASAPVYNRGTAYGRNDFETTSGGAGTPAAVGAMQAANYAIEAHVTTIGWTAAQILADIDPATAFYVNTHGEFDGSNPYFTSDLDEVSSSENIYARFVDPEVLSVRQAAVGTGTPPRNSGSPPVTVAFVDACVTGSVNEFAAAFLWPYQTENGWTVDQSEVGWSIYTKISATTATQERFWDCLADGYTVDYARDEALVVYASITGDTVTADTMPVWGDFATTFHGVYRGINDLNPSTNWYR